MVSAMIGRLTPGRAFPGRTQVNVLLLGRDLDRDRHGQVVKTNGRTDTIILAHYDFADKCVNMLSIPRDTRVAIPHHGHHKINAAHAYGGPNLACRTVGGLLGVHPDDYIVVDFEGFEKAVDLIIRGRKDSGFMGYLKHTLIPDLKESGSRATAEDFEEAIEWMQKGGIRASSDDIAGELVKIAKSLI